MAEGSFQFAAFGLLAALLSNLSRSPVWRSGVLLLASAVFLGLLAPTPHLLLPLVGFVLLGYVALMLVQAGWPKSPSFAVLAVVVIYIWLKQYSFLPSSSFLPFAYFTLGLSYIFFRVLHLLIDTAERPRSAQLGPGAYLLYMLNFTTLISGPIQRYEEFAQDQFADPPPALGSAVVGLQLERIVRGLFKVNIMAMLLHMMQQDALAGLSQPLPLSMRLLAAFELAVAYPFFLYCNFSGYIDIVIAAARLMRVRLPANFARPFAATSFLDFWGRWHISLSNWLKTYVYNPLLIALMRRISSERLHAYLGVLCFFVTFFLIGIWHGRTSEFAVFGLLQGGGVAVNKLWQLLLTGRLGRQGYRLLASNPVYRAVGRGLTFSWFAFSLFWFWADWKQIDLIFAALGATRWLAVWSVVWMAATVMLAAWEALRSALHAVMARDGLQAFSGYARVMYASALGVVAFVVTVLLDQPAPDIVYKGF